MNEPECLQRLPFERDRGLGQPRLRLILPNPQCSGRMRRSVRNVERRDLPSPVLSKQDRRKDGLTGAGERTRGSIENRTDVYQPHILVKHPDGLQAELIVTPGGARGEDTAMAGDDRLSTSKVICTDQHKVRVLRHRCAERHPVSCIPGRLQLLQDCHEGGTIGLNNNFHC